MDKCACCRKPLRDPNVRQQVRVKETGQFVLAGADCYRKVHRAGEEGLVIRGTRYVY